MKTVPGVYTHSMESICLSKCTGNFCRKSLPVYEFGMATFVKRNDNSRLHAREIFDKISKIYFRGRQIDGMFFAFSNHKAGSYNSS